MCSSFCLCEHDSRAGYHSIGPAPLQCLLQEPNVSTGHLRIDLHGLGSYWEPPDYERQDEIHKRPDSSPSGGVHEQYLPSGKYVVTKAPNSYYKETKWAHEKEWRLILNFNSAACNVGKHKTGTDLLSAISPHCVVGVTIGHNAGSEFLEQVTTAISKNPSLSLVSVKMAKQNEGL